MSTIVDHIGVPALLEQTAEECCELAQACLKMARKLRDENPTPKSIEDIRESLVEELADVDICTTAIIYDTQLASPNELDVITIKKHKRWKERLEQHVNLDVFEDCDK